MRFARSCHPVWLVCHRQWNQLNGLANAGQSVPTSVTSMVVSMQNSQTIVRDSRDVGLALISSPFCIAAKVAMRIPSLKFARGLTPVHEGNFSCVSGRLSFILYVSG